MGANGSTASSSAAASSAAAARPVRLAACNRQLTSLPDEWLHRDLLELDLSFNQFTRLRIVDAVAKRAPRLERLVLTGNLLARFPTLHLFALHYLSVEGNAIAELAEEVEHLRQLADLYAANNQIRTITSSIGRLTLLRTLHLGGNSLIELPDAIGLLQNLESLNVSFNALRSLPPALNSCVSLQFLRVQGNRLETLPALSQLRQLTLLDASYNCISVLADDFFAQLDSLRTIALGHNRLTTLRAFTNGLRRLNELVASHNAIVEIVEPALVGLHHLRELDLSGNGLERLSPEPLMGMTRLTSLDLSYNRLTALSLPLSQLSALASLNVGHNPTLSEADADLCLLPALERLHAFGTALQLHASCASGESGCGTHSGSSGDTTNSSTRSMRLSLSPAQLRTLQLSELCIGSSKNMTVVPSALLMLARLRVLTLIDCALTTLPDDLFVHCASVRALRLSFNRLAALPSSLFRLGDLDELSVSWNPLAIDADTWARFRQLTCLSVLRLAACNIDEFPASLMLLPQIVQLDLSHNRLRSVPETLFTSLQHLRSLDLSYNALAALPRIDSLHAVRNLREFYAAGNELTVAPVILRDADLVACRLDDNPVAVPTCLADLSVASRVDAARVDRNSQFLCIVPPARGPDRSLSPAYGVSFTSGMRPYMEDGVVIGALDVVDDAFVCALLDGHGGAEVMQYTVAHFCGLLDSAVQRFTVQALREALSSTFMTLHERVVAEGFPSGAVFLATVLCGNELAVAHVGDARCVLVSPSGAARTLTVDHKATRFDEAERIRQHGGFVSSEMRVQGVLAVSRAIGDQALQAYVSCEPDVCTVQLDETDARWMVLACDGVWDVLDENDVAGIVCRAPDALLAARWIRERATLQRSSDNITCVVVDLAERARLLELGRTARNEQRSTVIVAASPAAAPASDDAAAAGTAAAASDTAVAAAAAAAAAEPRAAAVAAADALSS